MSVNVGTRLGSLEITALLGKGGMGEVYRARDAKLKRDVAIKVLPDEFSRDADRVSRFQREAEVLASLNHPNIAAIYDLQEVGATRFLVLELAEGETLAERIQRGPIPVVEALEIAKNIGDALEAAHDCGIIHRDLKPANIKLTPNGTVKILDFGLAKAFQQQEFPSLSNSPTLISASVPGVILGTAAYMSPEQAKGRPVDKRADIWAFGVVLYEMLSGQRLFEGESASESLASVLTKEPELERVPTKARRLLKSCLEKDCKQRLRDIGDAWRLLEETPRAPSMNSRLPWVAAGVLAVVAIALGATLWRFTRPIVTTPQPAVGLDLDLGPDVSLGSGTGPSVILSPDGARLVFVSEGADGLRRLFTRRLDQAKVTPLAKTEGAYAPFFSPDGDWVGFFAQGKLKKTRIDGGEPVPLCDAPNGRGASWGEDGNIIAALDPLAGLSLVPPGGGTAVALTDLGPEENTHRWPYILPGGKAVLFNASVAYGNYDEASIAVMSLKDHRRQVVLEHAGMYPRYLPSGHLVYVTKGTLFAVPFDLDRLEVQGSPSLLGEVASNPNLGFAQLDFSRNGTFAYRTGGTDALRTLQWLDDEGRATSLELEPAIYISPRLSPDGDRLAYLVVQGANTDIWIYELHRGSKTKLTSGGYNAFPTWSPDSQYLVFQSSGGMFWTRSDGAGKPQRLLQGKTTQFPNSYTRDGTLVFSELNPGGPEIRTVPVENRSGQLQGGEPQIFLKTSTANNYAAFSPNGRWLAYGDAEAGRYEVYVRAFPDNGTKVQISNTGGFAPVWSRNGREIFYQTEDQRIMVANYSVKAGTFVVVEKPRVWSQKHLANVGIAVEMDLADDGKRFIAMLPVEGPEPRETQSHVKIFVNFFDEIRRHVAAKSK